MAKKSGDKDTDTITAIATAPGIAGIGIVRISGPLAINIADKLWDGKKRPSMMKGFEATFGYVRDDEEILDEAILLVMRAPKSYTREDVVEFQLHGGPIVLRRVLDAVLKKGARLAHPGEFTKRAFLSGRIDLAQAEAVASLVFAQTTASARASVRGLSGELGSKIKNLKKELTEILAEIEAQLDFAEEDIEFISRDKIKDILNGKLNEISSLLLRCEAGMVLSEGIRIVIAGKPNVGKSTLMNALLEKDRVIVTPYPGTTRDVIEEMINISGVPVKISDTAGIRDDADGIEKKGVEKSKTAIREADLILLLLDASASISEHDRKIIRETTHLKRFIILNKIDLKQKINLNTIKKLAPEDVFLKISAKKGTGLNFLRKKIEEMLWKGKLSGEDALVASLRQIELLKKTKSQIELALNATEENLSEEFISAELRKAVQCLSEITGESISEEILDLIFNKFCIGK